LTPIRGGHKEKRGEHNKIIEDSAVAAAAIPVAPATLPGEE